MQFKMSRISLFLMLCLLLTVLSVDVPAQLMGSTVRIVSVKFAAGKRQVTMRGMASDLVTYVYKINLRKGQMIAVKIDSGEPELTFSVFSGMNERLGFRVEEWSDTAYSSGTYSIVLVLSREVAALHRKLQYGADAIKRLDDEITRMLKAEVRDGEVRARGGSETEKLLNTFEDEKAAQTFKQRQDLSEKENRLAELKARQREAMEKIPYSLSIKVK